MCETISCLAKQLIAQKKTKKNKNNNNNNKKKKNAVAVMAGFLVSRIFPLIIACAVIWIRSKRLR
jgi:hypothetical protein